MLKSSDLNSRKRRKRRIAWDFQKPVTGRKTYTHTHQLTPLLLPQILFLFFPPQPYPALDPLPKARKLRSPKATEISQNRKTLKKE
jgi:hypothetical protein